MNQGVMFKNTVGEERHAVLFGFWRNLSSHPERSPLNQRHISALGIKENIKTKSSKLVSYSIGYGSAHDRPACID